MNRRQSIRTIGGVAAFGAGYAWMERRGLQRRDLPDPDPPDSVMDPSIHSLLEYASMAPSGHNAQPWAIRLSGKTISIGSDKSRWLPHVDPMNRELALSVGAFLENLLAAAPHHGFHAEYDVTGLQPGDDVLVQVQLEEAEIRPSPLRQIRERRTLRSGQLRREISSAHAKQLTAHFPQAPAFFFSPSSREGRLLAEGTIEANLVQSRRDAAQEELANWIRWSNAEGRAHRDGLTPESMGIEGLAGWYVRHFMDRDSVLTPKFRQQSVDAVRDQVSSRGGWIAVTSPDRTLRTLLETGRATERMWLQVRDLGIAVHPMTQILEESPFRERIARDLGVSGDVQFLLRIGYVDAYPPPVSLRRPARAMIRA